MSNALWALIRLRLRALTAGTVKKQGRRKNSKGSTVLFIILYLYLAIIFCGLFGMTFSTLAEPYHMIGLDWLYFALASLLGTAFSLFGSVFMTQNQLYDAKDNDQLLAMPIHPWMVLFSRMLSLWLMSFIFTALVMVPALVVYGLQIGYTALSFIYALLGFLVTPLLGLGIACILGWLLHLLLQRANKSLVSMVYMIAFLAVYLYLETQANTILNTMAANGEAVSAGIRSWAWVFYAYGAGSAGSLVHCLIYLGIVFGVFGIIYWFLSVTFLRSALAGGHQKTRRKVDLNSVRSGSPVKAIVAKEWRRFIGSPTYLTNMGLGIIMIAALGVVGVIFRREVTDALSIFGDNLPLFAAMAMIFSGSMAAVSAPSISLEGKSLWIMRAMPLSGKAVLQGKLLFHVLCTVPVSAAAGLALAIAYGFSPAELILTVLLPSVMALFSGLLGLLTGLKWPRFDWTSEAYPCKQAGSVAAAMFIPMGISMIFVGVVFALLANEVAISPVLILLGFVAAMGLIDLVLWRTLFTWGAETWESLY